jgi:hypothetical protein
METLNLRRPIYKKSASYGPFGKNDKDFTWENTDVAPAMRMEAFGGKAKVKSNKTKGKAKKAKGKKKKK